AEPLYELKMGFSLHAYICAEHVAALRKRVAEMREPPLGLEAVPHPALEIFFDEILATPTTEALLLGLYDQALPASQAGWQARIRALNPLAHLAALRFCRFGLMEVEQMLHFGRQSIAAMVTESTRQQLSRWQALLQDCLNAAGSLNGTRALADR